MKKITRVVPLSILCVWILGMSISTAEVIRDEIDQAVIQVADDPEARTALEEECIELATTEDDISFAERYRAFRILEIIGTERCIEPLSALLDDPEHAHLARNVLETLPYDAADDALLEALTTASGVTRLGIIGTLGVRRTTDAVDPLTALLAHDDAATADGAASALGRIGTPAALESLRARLDETVDDGRKPALYNAILNSAEILVKDGREDTALAAYEPLMDEDRPAHIRAGAFRGTLAAQPSAAPDLAYQAIHGEDELFQREAFAVLSVLDSDELAERLVDDFEDFANERKVLLLDVFAEWRDPVALPVVNRSLLDEDADVRMAAIQAVRVVGDVSSIEPLGRILAETVDTSERRGAIESLRRLEGPDMNANLAAYLEEASMAARPHIITALAQREAVEAVDAIMAQIEHEPIRVPAFRALNQLAQPEHLTSMLDLLIELEGDTGRRDAIGAVVALVQRMPKETVEQVIEAVDAAPDAEARVSLLRVLSGLGGQTAFDATVGHLYHDDERIHNGAVRALADWPETRALDVLVGLSRNAPEAVHRTLALRGAVRLLRDMDPSSSKTLTRYVALTTDIRTDADFVFIFSGLSRVEHPAALRLLESYLDDDDVGEEALIAFRQVAEALGKDPDTTLADLDQNTMDGARFKPLFDGESLEGWHGDPALWRVEDGHIIGETDEDNPLEHNSFLVRDRVESDFELKFSYRIDTPWANSGVQVRSEVFEEYRVRGYQLAIATTDWMTGICYEEDGRGVLARRGQQVHLAGDGDTDTHRFAEESALAEHINAQDWNEYQVIALDNRLVTFINGHLMHEVIDDTPSARDRGIIAFQLHTGDPMTVRFRDIKLKRLSDE